MMEKLLYLILELSFIFYLFNRIPLYLVFAFPSTQRTAFPSYLILLTLSLLLDIGLSHILLT